MVNHTEIFRIHKNDFELEHFTRIRLNNVDLWLCVREKNSVIFYDECAHMGGRLYYKKGFVCNQHGWTFLSDGSNVNQGSPGLRRPKVKFEDNECIEIEMQTKPSQLKVPLVRPLTVEVISHACLLLTYDTKRILFDPWIFGPAYYGSWHLFPEPQISAKDLDVDAIVITHPHPDHFHLETLRQLDSEIPIYFPRFPSRIIENGLSEIGWKNIKPSGWNESIEVDENFKLSFIRPRSNWEDSATLFSIEDNGCVFSWLNLVDAGSVLDPQSIPEIDLLSSAFDQGASGYPLTWNHIGESAKKGILAEQKKQTLAMLSSRAVQFTPKYFLPFAGHWRLGLPEHQIYADKIPHTTFKEIDANFLANAPETIVLGVTPGNRFDFLKKEVTSSSINFVKFNSKFRATQILRAKQDLASGILISEFEKKMEGLTQNSEAFRVEKVNFKVLVPELNYVGCFPFASLDSLDADPIEISVEVPLDIFALYAEGSANWDHIAIGYWGVWDRSSNVYPANFMRLLQAGRATPYSNRSFFDSKSDDRLLEASIADLLETHFESVSSILNRAGLPCISCTRTNGETLRNALEIHSVDLSANPWIISELRSIGSDVGS
jgi:CMP-N-acetylneuraminate monooxygenase